MINRINKIRIGDSDLEKYVLDFGSFMVGSDDPTMFTIRVNELVALSVTDLPYRSKFIICDDSRYLINIRSYIERIDKESLMLTIEESSRLNVWVDMISMSDYYNYRREMLQKRQSEVFDLILDEAYCNNDKMFLQYKNIVIENPILSAIKYSSTVLKTANLASNVFNV